MGSAEARRGGAEDEAGDAPCGFPDCPAAAVGGRVPFLVGTARRSAATRKHRAGHPLPTGAGGMGGAFLQALTLAFAGLFLVFGPATGRRDPRVPDRDRALVVDG